MLFRSGVPDYAFCKGELKYGKETIREVYLPESCLSIGSDAFYGCVNLRTVDAPNAVPLVSAFQHCNLDKLIAAKAVIPSTGSVKLFEYGKSVTVAEASNAGIIDTVYCHTGITSIGVFGANFKNVIFGEPASIKVIETNDFKNCGFKKFVLPASVETIQTQAFVGNNLELFVIPKNSKLTKIETEIGYYGEYIGAFSKTLNNSNLSILCYLDNIITINCLFYTSSSHNHYNSIGMLYVPKKSVEKYKASHWSEDFADVVAIEDSEYANWGL